LSLKVGRCGKVWERARPGHMDGRVRCTSSDSSFRGFVSFQPSNQSDDREIMGANRVPAYRHIAASTRTTGDTIRPLQSTVVEQLHWELQHQPLQPVMENRSRIISNFNRDAVLDSSCLLFCCGFCFLEICNKSV